MSEYLLGRINRLEICEITARSVYLHAGELGEALLLNARQLAQPRVGDELEVFLYVDSDDTLVASLEHPRVQAGECAYLPVVALSNAGAFLNWGLNSDLFVPRSQQMGDMRVGQSVVAYAYLDPHNERMIASCKLHKHLSEQGEGFKARQKVSLQIYEKTQLGYKAVVDGSHIGLLHHEAIFQPLQLGQQLDGFIHKVRDDKKLDLVLQLPPNNAQVDELSERILDYLKAHQGVSSITDKSPPDVIYQTFGVSKGVYKRTLGKLYKMKKVQLSKDAVKLL